MRPTNWCLAAVASLAVAANQASAVVISVNPADNWIGFMNVFQLPANGGGYVFGSPWGTADLRASFSGPTLTLSPNTITPAPDPNDPNFWYVGGPGPGNPGNKNMDASMYVENNALAGQSVTFTGIVTQNSLVAPYTSVAFIKDFAPDYSSNVSTTVPLTPGLFSITLATINDPARHVQYGFETIGPNVWPTQAAPLGSASVIAVPEPASLAALAGAGLLVARRRRV